MGKSAWEEASGRAAIGGKQEGVGIVSRANLSSSTKATVVSQVYVEKQRKPGTAQHIERVASQQKF